MQYKLDMSSFTDIAENIYSLYRSNTVDTGYIHSILIWGKYPFYHEH